MWEALGTREDSFYFENFAYLLDQFLVNKNMATTAGPFGADPATVQLVRSKGMTSSGTYPTPIPFGGMGNPVNINGYSDHLPISMLVTETT